MTLGELIDFLEPQNPVLVLPEGFATPHSYRGYYDELAFEPAQNVTVGAMLDSARSAVGATYGGWKGGDFTMDLYTTVHLAVEGCTGEGIGPVVLRLMLAAGREAAVTAATPAQPAPELAAYEADIASLTDQRNRVSETADQLREQLGVLQDSIGNLAAGLKLSADASRPSKKSEIEDGCAAALLGILDPR